MDTFQKQVCLIYLRFFEMFYREKVGGIWHYPKKNLNNSFVLISHFDIILNMLHYSLLNQSTISRGGD